MDISKLNIIELLQNNDIDYKTEGKNIGQDWIGISPCPSCDDARYHAAINKIDGHINCWVCGRKTSFIKFIMITRDISYDEAKEYIKELTGEDLEDDEEDLIKKIKNIFTDKDEESIQKIEEKIIQLPKNVPISTKLIKSYPALQRFLEEKNLKRSDCEEYNLRIGTDGVTKGQIIFPVFIDKKLVAYQTRSLVRKGYHSHGKIKNYIYKSELINPQHKLIVVEGILDYIIIKRFISKFYKNKYSVTTGFSKFLSEEQISIIKDYTDSVIFLLDGDSWFDYYKSSQKIDCTFVDFIILKKDQDPNILNQIELLRLFNNYETTKIKNKR